jgi:XTP/dITP diphosphohydrolase
MPKVVVATRNAGKVRELRALFAAVPGIELMSLDEAGVAGEPTEDGATLEANAAKKALFYAQRAKAFALADDSGFEVEALGGAPGVYSARFAGEGATDAENVALVLARMTDVPDGARAGRFRCVLALADGRGATPTVLHQTEGAIEGDVTRAPRGTGGFGYDPIFVPAGDRRTYAELSSEEKNRFSHRAQAARAMAAWLATNAHVLG